MVRRGRVVNRGDKRKPNWSFMIDVAGPGEPRKQQRRSGFRTRGEAQGALNDVVTAMQKGTFVEPSKVTVGEFLSEWLDAVRSTVRPSTLSSYRSIINEHVAPAIGRVKLQALTADRINAMYGDLLESGRRDGKGMSPKTVRNVHVVIRKALGDALRWDRVSRNVAALADPPKLRASRRAEMKTWGPAELRAFLEAVAEDDLVACWTLAANTGLRRGEVLGIRWQDINLEEATLSIRQTIISVDYQIKLSEPKTSRGRRTVDLDGGTVAALRTHRTNQTTQRVAFAGTYQDQGLVFCRPDGSPIHPQLLSDRFDRLVKGSGLPRVRLHDLRHTHASLALQAGVPVKVVSERLGHASTAFTMDQYQHVIPGMQADAAELVARLVMGGGDQNVTKPKK